MKKSFKRAIAAVLAVLMVVTAFPMTAFAKPGDYNPDIQLEFHGFYDSDPDDIAATPAPPWTSLKIGATPNFGYVGPYDVAFDLTPEGKLVLPYARSAEWVAGNIDSTVVADTSKYLAPEDGLVLGKNNFFTVTVVLDNISEIWKLETRLQYSDNIEPAGVYEYKSGKKKKQAIAGISDRQGATPDADFDATTAFINGGINPVDGCNAQDFLDLDTGAKELSYIDHKNRVMHVVTRNTSGNASASCVNYESKNTDNEGLLVDPATGAAGYKFKNRAIIKTFAFKILDDTKPIEFKMYDPDASIMKNLNGGSYIANSVRDDVDASLATTYCYNKYVRDSKDWTWTADAKNSPLKENPGSRKMTFMGTNVNLDTPEPPAHEHVWGEWQSKEDGKNHIRYCTAPGCTDPVAEDIQACTPGEEEIDQATVVAPTCGKAGSHDMIKKCTVCGQVVSRRTVTDDPTGQHTWGDWQYDGGKTYTHTRSCTNEGCNVTETKACTYTSAVTKEATCVATGIRTYTCSVCKHQYTQIIDPLGHSLSPVDGKVASCKETGYKEAYYCSTCMKYYEDSKATVEIGNAEAYKTWQTTEGQGLIPLKAHTLTKTNQVDPKPGVAGVKAYWTCSVCGKNFSDADAKNEILDLTAWKNGEGRIPETGYTWTVVGKPVPNKDYTKLTVTVKQIEDPYAQEEVIIDISNDGENTPATCTAPAKNNYSATLAGKGYKGLEKWTWNEVANDPSGKLAPHTEGTPARENEVPATCTTEGSYDLVVRCTECNQVIKTEHKTIPALGHDWVISNPETDFTFAEDGKTVTNVTATCTRDGKHTKNVADQAVVTSEVTTQPTIKDPGTTTYTAKVVLNGKTYTATTTRNDVKQLDSCLVHIEEDAYGTIKGNIYGENNFVYGANTVEVGKEYTVVAEPLPGAEFLGWFEHGSLLTTSPTLRFTAYPKSTAQRFAPKFAPSGASDKMTVKFMDGFGNVVKEYNDMTAVDYANAIQKDGIPTAANVGSFQFKGWNLPDDEILALNHSQVIKAQYEFKKDGFTVTCADPDVTIQIAGGAENGAIAFDTAVTVTKTGALNWVINGTVVGYGESYTFYVGSDVTISAGNDAVLAKPSVVLVEKTLNGNTANFLGTRIVPDGYKLVDSGMIVAKTADPSILTIEHADKNYNGTRIYSTHCNIGGADQFLQPITGKTPGTWTVKAFVVYQENATGDIVVTYSENVMQHTFA